MSQHYEACPGVVWRALDDGLVLLDSARGLYFELNASARQMFEALCAGQPRSELLAGLSERFDVDPTTLAHDFDALCQQLLQQGLIRRIAP